MNEEYFFIQLRDCFTAGYTMPQFCLDNGIKKPLFVAKDASAISFLWELYVQFRYDKRLFADFAIIDGQNFELKFTPVYILGKLKINQLSAVNLQDFDKIIMLSAKKFSDTPNNVLLYLDILTQIFIRRTYVDIPLSYFLQKYPNVKLIVASFPVHKRSPYNTAFEQKLFEDLKTGEFFKIRGCIHKEKKLNCGYEKRYLKQKSISY